MELLIDSSRESLSLALTNNNQIIFTSNVNSHSKHSNFLMNEIKEKLLLNNIDLNNIDSFISLIGPGSFTGVRVGVTVSKTLAWSLNKKLYLINNLESLKVGIKDDIIITVIQDKPKYSYVGIYDNTKSLEDYLSIDDEKLNFIDKNITIVSLTNNEYLNNLFDKLSVKNNVKLEIIKDYKYIDLVNYALKSKPVNIHLAKPLYLKKIDAEK